MTKTIFLSCLLLAGCAPMSEMACRTADWYEQGHAEALTGNRAKAEQYAQCSGFQEKEYLAGWSVGYSEWNQRVSGSRM
ncbi:MAG TPA: hypothetical protein VM140_05530 [Burkholderiales bacterium]|nr:hypothetical protein [Burkholderiales bacterium]